MRRLFLIPGNAMEPGRCWGCYGTGQLCLAAWTAAGRRLWEICFKCLFQILSSLKHCKKLLQALTAAGRFWNYVNIAVTDWSFVQGNREDYNGSKEIWSFAYTSRGGGFMSKEGKYLVFCVERYKAAKGLTGIQVSGLELCLWLLWSTACNRRKLYD